MQIFRSSPLPVSAAPAGREAHMTQAGQRTAMSFDVDPRSHAVTVSVVDPRSGEILQQMVYDKRVHAEQGKARRTGLQIDVRA